VCLCTGEGACAGQHPPAAQSMAGAGKTRGDLVPASPSILIHSLWLLEEHNPHLGSRTPAFCAAVVRVGFSPCPCSAFQRMCREWSSNASVPHGSGAAGDVGMLEED